MRALPLAVLSLDCLLLVGGAWAAAPGKGQGGGQEKEEKVEKESGAKVKAVKGRLVTVQMAEGLRFDPPRFEAKAGESLVLRVENLDPSHLAHNLVVVRPGKVQEVVQMAMAMGEAAVAKAFVPEHAEVLAATSRLVDPEKKLEVAFTLPAEPGVYGYVCTVPGHGMLMYGAIYAGTPLPPLAKDTNIPQLNLEKGLAGGGQRPYVQRLFVPEAGPAAINVALPGTQNYCFDAGTCSVRFAWEGAFLNAAGHWRGNGAALGELGDVPWWRGEVSPWILDGERVARGKAKFLGYQLQEGLPEFRYRVEAQAIFQRVTPLAKGLEMHFRLPGNRKRVGYGVGNLGPGIRVSGSSGALREGVWEFGEGRGESFWLRVESTGGGTVKHGHGPDVPGSGAKSGSSNP